MAVKELGSELVFLTQAAGLIIAAFAVAVAALVAMALRPDRAAGKAPQSSLPKSVFIFDGDALVDATDAARRLLELTPPCESDIQRLVSFLAPRFPELPDSVMQSSERRTIVMTSADGLSRLHLQVGPSRLRLTLTDLDATAPGLDQHGLAALTQELQMHRAVADHTPFPVWRQSGDGRIVWANAQYCALAAKLGWTSRTAPTPPRIFPTDPIAETSCKSIQRTRLELPDEDEPRWFEYQVTQIGSDALVAAFPVDRVVQAERNLGDFTQTLTQTFAHLSVGLAIFNRSRELAVFNPALTDLLGLSPEYLITRPTLFQMFDRLREHRLMPEPKNYKTWRQKMSEIEAAAADGVHSETWSLADGRTYRVTGRPHPAGAVAFVFEDISAGISQERRLRSDLQLGQAVIDGLDEAMAVFTPSGELAMSNRAYAKLWDGACDADGTATRFLDASRIWQNATVPTPVWGDVRDFAVTLTERTNWTAEVRLRDGRRLNCRFDTMPGRCTLVGFSIGQDTAQAPRSDLRESASA
ncbi:MAG: PAS-domain containing protein [Rhodobacter sp.]|nr:PAS-domain containing protein [Rhodobacter sp.]